MRLLINFNYSRNQWVELLAPLYEEFEIHWIRYIGKEEDKTQHLPTHQYHYWSNYEDSGQLIENIRPQAVVIMDNKPPLSIALIHQARKNKIPVFYLQHGILANFKDYNVLESNITTVPSTSESVNKIKQSIGFNTLSFVKKSLGKRFYWPPTLLYLLLSKYISHRKASYYIKDATRLPDIYLCFSHENAQLHFELDGVGKNKIALVGNPELEKIVRKYHELTLNDEKIEYWLHIDQPLSGGDLGENFISRNYHHDIYTKLSEKAKSEGCRLIVKLHPGSYSDQDLPKDENIDWVKETEDITTLIKGAKVCTGFYSSLLVPCIAFKPTILVQVFDISWYKNMSNLTNVLIVKNLNEFSKVLHMPPSPSSETSIEFLSNQGYNEKHSFKERLISSIKKFCG